MRVTRLSIKNYKSLRSLDITPTPLTILVGANGSGKTNFADSLDFISEIYRHGLEVAVARKGGYENIAHRKKRRSKAPIEIDIDVEMDKSNNVPRYRVHHAFSFATKGGSIRAAFSIVHEHLDVTIDVGGAWHTVGSVDRDRDTIVISGMASERLDELLTEVPRVARTRLFNFSDVTFLAQQKGAMASTELFAVAIGRFVQGLRNALGALSSMRVFQLSPTHSRGYGVPTPQPELDRYGDNLPAVVSLFQESHPTRWEGVLRIMGRIMPGLEKIVVGYTPNRTLGLSFHEAGVGTPWSLSEISDGTIQSLALLLAIYDPRSALLVLEEPENSVHPWILRNILEACREASATKQIILTTHASVVLNEARPEEVWVIWRRKGESRLRPLLALDPEFKRVWEDGRLGVFEFLDTGTLEEAVPPKPQDEQGELFGADDAEEDEESEE